jgi:hypothetical protein
MPMNQNTEAGDQPQRGACIMADQKSLGIIGFILGGVTATVMAIGVFVVASHVGGHMSLEDRPVVSASLPTVVR